LADILRYQISIKHNFARESAKNGYQLEDTAGYNQAKRKAFGMKVVILAGGFGTRISEESHLKPKPMIEIGGRPMLWHVLKSFSRFGYNEFIICAGYRQDVIKEYFSNYYLHHSDVTFNFAMGNNIAIHDNVAEPWQVTIVDTGLNTMTGGRVKRIEPFIGREPFFLTYGDGVADINIDELLKFHQHNHAKVTITAVQPGGRFGMLDVDGGGKITNFIEKRKEDGGWINGGFMVCEPQLFEYIHSDETILEREPLEKLANEGNLAAYKHPGFWQCMDTLRDKLLLEELIIKGEAPWIKW
jgi:glucose-1-phosphate cytidylyltransferase